MRAAGDGCPLNPSSADELAASAEKKAIAGKPKAGLHSRTKRPRGGHRGYHGRSQ
jgi:hypothetical protein